MDVSEAVSGAVGGSIAALFAWLLGRSDTAAQRRRTESRAVAREVLSETGHGERLARIEATVSSCERGVDEVKASVAGVSDKLDQILLSGRIHIK